MAVAVREGHHAGRAGGRHPAHQVRHMASTKKKPAVAEFGDFQTPRTLARQVCKLLADRGLSPAAIVEPTCGIGNFLFAALERFPTAASAVGIEINSGYVEKLMDLVEGQPYGNKVRVFR